MTAARGAALATTLALILVTVASGPLVAADLTRSGSFPDSLYQGFGAGGGVDVERQLGVAPQPLPTRATLEETDDHYTLSVPAAQVRVSTGETPAKVTYRLRVPALDAQWQTSQTVGAGRTETLLLQPNGSVPTADRDSYPGTLALVVEQGTLSFSARERNVTVEVKR